MRFSIPTFFIVFYCSVSLFAQSRISGSVTDADSGVPLSGVHISIGSMDLKTISDEKGTFEFEVQHAGKYELLFSMVGYAPERKFLNVIDNENHDFTIKMKSISGVLDVVTIVGNSMTGGEQQVKELPGSAYYISPLQLRKFSYTDINMSLRQVPGINLQEEDGFGLRPNIGLRGTGVERSSKITLMEDGVLAAPAPYSAPAAYYFPTIGRMHAVEVVKGSSQIKYGPFTTGGAINLLSTPIPESFNAYLHVAGGSFNSREVHAHVGKQHQYVSYMVETFQYSSDGYKDLDNGGNTGFNKEDYLFKFKIHNKSSAAIGHGLLCKAGISNESSNETYLGLTENDFQKDPYRRYAASGRDEMNTKQEQYSVSYILKFKDKLSVNTTVYRSKFKRNWYKLDSVTDTSGTKTSISDALEDPSDIVYGVLTGNDINSAFDLNVKANNRSYFSRGIQTNARYSCNTGVFKHLLFAGVRLHEDEVDRYQWVDDYTIDKGIMFLEHAGIPGTESNKIEGAKAVASYLQYKLNYDNWNITPGIRNEQIDLRKQDFGKSDPGREGSNLKENSNNGSIWIPGVSVDVTLAEKFFLFAGVHKGFSPASSDEGSKPEESINYEMGVRKNKGNVQGQLILFYNDYSNLLGSDLAAGGGSGSGAQFNAGEVETKGIELQVRKDWLLNGGLDGTINSSIAYTYTDANFLNSFESEFEGWEEVRKGDALPYLAKNQFNLLVGYTYSKFNFNISARYQDPMRTVAGQGTILDEERIEKQFLVDLAGEYRIDERLSVFVSVINLTDEEYAVSRRPAGLRPGLPRFIKVGVRLNVL